MSEVDPLEQRKSKYDVNPLLLKRWSPKSFVHYEIPDDDLFNSFELEDGHLHLTMDNHGGSYMQKEIILKIGINF